MKLSYYTLLLPLMLLLAFSCKKRKDLGKDTIVPQEVNEKIDQKEGSIFDFPADSVVVSYERTSCFGTCPTFQSKIYGDGRVWYKGIRFVEHEGIHNCKIDTEVIARIIAKANELNYWEMKETYNNPMVSDLPATITSIRNKEGEMKYVNNRYDGPKELRELYKIIDEAYEGCPWKSTEDKQ